MGSTRKSAPAAKKAPTRRTKSTAGVAQAAEQAPSKHQVAGSTPAPRSKILLERLNPKQRAFCLEYQKDRNATQAAIRAGYSPATARAIGSENLQKPDIAEACQALADEHAAAAQAETGITLERVLRYLARGAFFDPRKLFNPDGSPKNIADLDDETAVALQGLDVLEEFEGAGKDRVFVGYTKRYRLADRKAYLDMLMQHLGGYDKDRRAGLDTLAALLGTIQRSALPVVKQVDDDDA